MSLTCNYSNEKTSIIFEWQFQKSALLYQKKGFGKLFGKRRDIGKHRKLFHLRNLFLRGTQKVFFVQQIQMLG